jgi:salicylate hydroxylase
MARRVSAPQAGLIEMRKGVRRVAIVGAGLGGLMVAIALRRHGFEVKVYEQSPALGAFGAGINISPNAVKVFEALGLRERLHAVSFEPTGLIWRDWGNGKVQNLVTLVQAASRFGANYYVVHRSDLHALLASAVPDSSIEANKRCVGIELTTDGAGLSFADGSRAEADLVVGCDGIRSAVRRSVFGGGGPRYAGYMCWRTLVPAAALPANHHDLYVTNWTGTDGFIISYYVRQGKFINIVAVRRQDEWTEESWSVPSTKEELVVAFPHVGPQVGEMLRNAGEVFKWGQFMGEHTAQWTKGRVALLGDAAHAMLATFGQGAAMTFEDSYVLAQWLAANRDDYAAALAGYEATRKPRASRIQRLSRTEARFKKLRSPLERLRREWTYLTRFGTTTPGIYRSIFAHDPTVQDRRVSAARIRI